MIPGSTDTNALDPTAALASNGWCVMKYEASYVGYKDGQSNCYYAEPYNNASCAGSTARLNANITSQPNAAPINYISRDESEALCSGSYLRDQSNTTTLTGGHLISARLWSKIARDIEQQPINWSSNTVGTGYMSRGYANYSVDEPTTCDQATNASRVCPSKVDDADATVSTSSNPTGYYTKRAWKLSNGSWVHDLAGNVWEWYYDMHNNV